MILYLTQSLWRDEVYSILMAAKPISVFIQSLIFEPPLYYILLHFWIKLFGMSEIAGRSLSLVGLAGATGIVIYWAKKLFPNHWLSWWFPIFFFFNPMLLYYGMELRTYGWYIFFATLSLYAYEQKKWTIWTVATLLGFYTHTFLIIVPAAQVIHFLFTRKRTKHVIWAFGLFCLGIFPWVIKILINLKGLSSSWYFPVDANLITSVLGNLFLGYEGTPGYLWPFTKILSIGILAASYMAVRSPKTREVAKLFIVQVYLPLLAVIGVSFFKPLYVNRYMIAVTIAEVFLIALAISSITNRRIQKAIGAVLLSFIIIFNLWYPTKHQKVDFRKTFSEIQKIKSPTDVILADNPLSLFESMYYAPSDMRVFLYNPHHIAFPSYVGEGLLEINQIVDEFPPYPIRGFLIHDNGMYDLVYTVNL